MQNNVIDKPYRFVPPLETDAWPSALQWVLRPFLKYQFGVHSVECRGAERLRASIAAGHGVLLTPNHSRPSDPFVLGMLSRQAGRHFFQMASRHLFEQSRWQQFILQRAGGFSVWREGMDRDAIRATVEILSAGRRPLVVFPEGLLTRTNDRLGKLMDGVVFMARSAARQRAEAQHTAGIVIHPVAIKYFFDGPIRERLEPVLENIERRFSWQPRTGEPLQIRIRRIGEALLSLKEVEYYGRPRGGPLAERVANLIEFILGPLEEEWLAGKRDPAADVAERVKRLRTAILPDMITDSVSPPERARRWRQLADIYLAQCLALYPPEYIRSRPTAERMLETVERFEEDLTDTTGAYGPLRAVVAVGEALPVSPKRERGPAGDPLLATLSDRLSAMLAELVAESRPVYAEVSPSPEMLPS